MGKCMKHCMLGLMLLLGSMPVLARGLTAREVECLREIRDEADFIVSRIDLINHDYEKQIRHSALGKYKSGDYSTIGLLDNTIRKYHRKLVRQYKNYPFRYKTRVKASPRTGSRHCLVQELRNESVGAIHQFELGWQKTLEKARKNASYFQQIDDMH